MGTAKVRNWWAARTASVRWSGPTAHPIFHPVNEKVLPSEDKVMVRSHIPGNDAMET